MTLSKADIVKSIMEQVRIEKEKPDMQQPLFPEFDYKSLTRKRALELVDATFEIIKSTLEKGENVLISGFGKFQVKFKWARKGRNPQTGEDIILDSRRVVTFQCSSKLRERINKNKK